MNLAHLQQNTRPLTLEFAGETLKFSYRPAEVTPAFSDGLGSERQPLVWALSKVLASWDLRESEQTDAPLVPITEQQLASLPTPFLRALLRGIMDDISVGEPFGATSKNG